MGGTSCDVALIKDGEPIFSSRGKIEGRDIAVPMMDINTVSAGGGTIAKVDRFGVLEVGPHSAGAVPGPACYGRGGEAATITDCNLVLGYLSADNFLGGRMQLDRAKANGGRRARGKTAVARYRRSGRRHRAHHRREDGGSDQGHLHHARPRSARFHAARLRRRRTACTPRAWRAISAWPA